MDIAFKTHINPMHAEAALAQLGGEPEPKDSVTIDLSQCEFIDPSAGWRLANGLRRHASRGLLDVILPDRTQIAGEHWFKSFTRTGLGYAIAFHCNRVRSALGEDITAEIKEYYMRVEGKPAATHILISGIRDKRPFNVDDFPQFNSKFCGLLSKLRAQTPKSDSLHALSTFVFEAIQNIYDHSHAKPLPPKTPVFDYLCVNYYKNIRNPPDVGRHLATYLKRLNDTLPQERRAGFMEVVVNDDGVGVAARQSQSPDIYWRAGRSDEREALIRALAKGGSIKFITQDCPIRYDPGLGTYKIIDALRKLSAFAFIRTGRLLAYFDGGSNSQEAFDIVGEDELGYMPGTALEVIIPIVDSQMRLIF
jgi:hypothetical protein